MKARCLIVSGLLITSTTAHAQTGWDARAAAAYLDARQTWWSGWQTAARDHQTACVSCHTALPFALARPALRGALRETEPSSAERRMLDDVIKRVTLWREVEPFYPDQTRGLPKTSESRGTESVLNALVLATRDAHAGQPSDDARAAFDNMWVLQFRSGELSGGWAWLNFHNEPWEGDTVAKVGSKIFAFLGSDSVGLKCGATREEADEWLVRFPDDASVMPYIGRSGWNTLRIGGAIPDEDLLEAVDGSYDTVVAKLPRRERP